ncbi:MAG: uroporphyrinogen decarboxylase family protein [bacterium]|jgi:uroporphyrinogen decarboxylase|nr:uroporphyrinogen decarboxylase family protein [bacterium]
MTSRQRILTTVKHEEPDRVPISPRMYAYIKSQYGDERLATHLKHFPDLDMLFIVNDGTPNYLEIYPDQYVLPDVKVDQKKYNENECRIVERTFYTPAGKLSDRTKIPPPGREYGISPNQIKTEYLVKTKNDLDALRFILHPINTDFNFLQDYQNQLGARGVLMVCVRSALDHNAGYARDLQDIMMDYFDDRLFFDELLDIFHQRSLAQIKAALEGGAEFIFGSWYFNSISAGWSPAIFKEVFAPHINDHVDITHRYGAYYDYYDDGKLNDSMELIANTGVDILETCTPPPVGDFDLMLAKQTIGEKTTIKGYIDLIYVVQQGTPELIDRTIRQAMEIAKPGGGFIIGSSDSFREGTRKKNIAAYFEACKKYGIY